jgi:nicotinamide riboside kinase
MLIAGTDTSSISLYYCLLLLVDNHEDLAALRLALKSPDLNAAESTLSSCLYEAIRMKTVGPVIMRKCTKPTSFTLEAGQQPLDIAKGTNVIIDNATMHQDDDLFAQTASEFQMRRWMPMQPRARQEIFRPFGSNDKGCVGQHLAMQEMRKILSALLKDFDFERHPSTASFQHLQTQWQVANVPLGSCLLRPIPRRLVTGVFLIGPPSSGKTTLLKRLRDMLQGRPIHYVEEVARPVMKEMGIDRSVFNDATPARVQAFQARIFARQQPQEMKAFQMLQDGRVELILADRSLLCPLVFGESEKCERNFLDGLRDELDRHYRDRPVHFILLPPEAEFQRDDGTRYNNFTKVEAMFQLYTAILDQLHLPYTILNCRDLERRVDAVLALPLPSSII